jgi:outer membrane protein insertion porin family
MYLKGRYWMMGSTWHRNDACRRLLCVVLALLFFVPAVAWAQEKQVVEIRIDGNEHVSNDAILAAISLKPGMPASEENLQAAQKAIQNMGYFERVLVGTETVPNGVRVVFHVIENPVVKEIRITGNTVVPTGKLQSLLRTNVGSVLNMVTLEQQDIPAIEHYYDEQGYTAFVTDEVGIDSKTGVLTIPIIESRIQEIRVTGNTKTKTYVILREMTLKPGDVFNRNVLFDDLRHIYDLDIFDRENAEPYKIEPGSELGKVIVTIPVKEKKTGELTLGAGYSSSQGLVGQVKIADNNFNGKAQTLSLSWEQAGFADNTSGITGASVDVSFFEPWLDTKHTSLNVDLYDKLVYRFGSSTLVSGSSNYAERHGGGSLTLGRPFSREDRGSFALRIESVDPNLLNATSSIVTDHSSVASGTFRFTNSSRDSELNPLTGGYNSAAIEAGVATASIGIDPAQTPTYQSGAISKLSMDIRRYSSQGGPRTLLNESRPVLAFRLMAGTVSGTTPFFEQYFVGGADTLRGFNEDRFWGRYMLVSNNEYRFPLGSSITGVMFVDAGDAWGADTQYLNPLCVVSPAAGIQTTQQAFPGFTQSTTFAPQLGYGVGIRVDTPIGPLRLDYGFCNEGSRAHFSIGHVF